MQFIQNGLVTLRLCNQFNSYFFLERFRYTTAKYFNKEFMNIANANNLIIPQNVLNIMQNNC